MDVQDRIKEVIDIPQSFVKEGSQVRSSLSVAFSAQSALRPQANPSSSLGLPPAPSNSSSTGVPSLQRRVRFLSSGNAQEW